MDSMSQLPDYAPVPEAALGPALNEQGYFVGRVERNLYWVTDGTHESAFLATPDGVVLFDAPPTIGHNLRRAVDEVAAAEGVGSTVTHLVYSHHHADQAGAADLFGDDIVRIGHAETRRLLLRDNDPTRPAPEVTFENRYTLEVGGARVELAYHGPNHSPDNIYIHFRTTTRSCSSTSSTPAGCRSTTSTSARTCPGTSAPRTRPWPTRGRTTSAGTSAGWALATTSSCTS
jgi:glyoxylase-like metal-dependent hydrolase (beta-lactamase superfamily II)